MNIIIQLFLFFVTLFMFSFTFVEAVEGINVWRKWYRAETFKCLKEELSAEFVIVFAAYVYDEFVISENAKLNILNARAAGIEDIDIYIEPCVKCNQTSENVTNVLNYLNENNAKFGNIWLLVSGLADSSINFSGWFENDKAKNVEFINKMVTTLINNNQTYGIYTNKYNWHEITGNTQIFNNSSLFYEHPDGKNNFDDYNEYGYPFGGWDKPKMKEYSYKTVCGIEVNNVWRP